jgi:alpha-glucosidase
VSSARPDGWWRHGVLYHIYVRSFADSNADGVGDLQGIVDHLDHLEWLGIDGVWLSPVTGSPDRDWGYDVSDFLSVQPAFGDLETLDGLVAHASKRGIRVVLDLVPNHTSDQHPWFVDSRGSRNSAQRDRYVWADPRPDGSPPNNWLSTFGGPAWTFDRRTSQFYLHNFLPEQPDLNWWNEDVRDAFDDILRYWFERGVAGFRIDVAHGIVKDRALRDNLPATENDRPLIRMLGQRQSYNMHQPEVHEVLRRWRRIADEYVPPRVLIGETWANDLAELARYYGSGLDELNLAFNFEMVMASFDPVSMPRIVDAAQRGLPATAWPVWTGSNHDVGRFPTRWCGGDEGKIRCALMMLLTLRGTPFLYYGDEVGMLDVPIPPEMRRDPVSVLMPGAVGRDPGRTPMQWTPDPGAGFTVPGAEPWLPIGDAKARNVRDQLAAPDSTLTFCRDLIALRRAEPDLHRGRHAGLEGPDGIWSWRRGERFRVTLNMSAGETNTTAQDGTIAIGTRRDRDGERIGRRLRLRGWEGVVVREE